MLGGLAFATLNTGQAQVQNNGVGQYWLNTTAPAPRTFSVGNGANTGFALDIHGEQMNPPLGNVFKTEADPEQDSYWRMFHSTVEYGQLFHLLTDKHFNINSPRGHLLFHTMDTRRARINGNVTTAMGPGNPFPSVNRDGFMVLSGQPDAFVNTGSRAPFTRLHLIDPEGSSAIPLVYAQEHGFRPWQKNGVTFTGNSDQAYIGQKYKGNDKTDFVLQWSDNPDASNYGTDRMKFVFTTEYNSGPTKGAASIDGLEAMRFWPKNNFEVNVGVGDFAPPAIGDPTERFHVLDGRVRIQELPEPAHEATGTFKVMVVDDAAIPSGERGVVKWKDVADLALTDCDWTVNPAVNNNVSTAFGPADPNCPDATDAVLIGSNVAGGAAPGKLTVATANNGFATAVNVTVSNSGLAFGALVVATGGGQSTRGVGASTFGTSQIAYAGDFQSFDTSPMASGVNAAVHSGTGFSVGVDGSCFTSGIRNYGTAGRAQGSGTINAGLYGAQHTVPILPPLNGNYGVFGTTENQGTGTDWAGYFRGDVTVTGIGVHPMGIWTPSDENLKENIADLPSGLEVISQLNPKSYNYQTSALPQVGLPTGQQYGFLAQELEQVIPVAVKDLTFQAQMDSTGQEIYPAVASKIVNTDMLIPFLVAAVKEQQALIANLQDQINNCCAAPGGMAPENGEHGAAPADAMLQEQRLLIIPNPVADLTRLEYYVPQAGKVSLQVSNSDGKLLATLREEMAQEGAHNYSWNTTDLAAGTYFCTYMLDGAVVVKRAVKVK